MPKGHSTIGSQRALIKRMGTQRIGITITATDPDTGAKATIYVAGLTLGTLTQAQKDAFRDQLAGVLGVSSDLITLTFKSGSLIIGITINPSEIRTPSDNAFILNAQASLSQITNTDISNIITASGTSAVITGTPVIDRGKTTVTIDPTIQTISSSNYTIQTFNNPVVGDNNRCCIYTLINSNIVRVNKNGTVELICSFPESTIKHIFITRYSGFLIIPSNNFSNDNFGTLYFSPHANNVYVVNISSGTVYINTTQIAYSPGLGFGFNQFNNKIYYGSAEVATYGTSYMSTIVFSTNMINSSTTGILKSLTNSLVFSDITTGYTLSNNSIVKVDLLNNTFTTVAGGDSALTEVLLGAWNNPSFPSPVRWGNSSGSLLNPFVDSQNGANAWFSYIYSSNLVLDSVNNRLLVSDRYAQRIRSVDLRAGNNYAVTTLAGTSPVFYGRAINRSGSTYTSEELASMGQVGAWNNEYSGMPAFSKVNSTYALSTFNEPSNIALFNNTVLVLDLTGTRILSNGYVNDLIVLDNKTDPIPLSSLGDATVTFKMRDASYLNQLTQTELDALKNQFLSKYPFITPNNISCDLINGSIIFTLTYFGYLDINLFSKYEVSTISNLASVFSDSISMLANFKGAVISTNLSNKFVFPLSYSSPITIIDGFNSALGVAVDSVGNVYISNVDDRKVNKVTPSGIVTTILTGSNRQWSVAVDSYNNIYITDTYNGLVKMLNSSGSLIRNIPASNPVSPGNQITGVAVDSIGNVYMVDQPNNKIKKVTPAGIITEIGSGFNSPTNLAVDSVGNVYVADRNNNKIKKVTPAGIITEIGNGFNRPFGVAVDSVGNVYVADTYNHKVKKVTPSGIITENGSGFSYPAGIAVDSVGNIYIRDSGNNKVKKVMANSVSNDVEISVNVSGNVVNKCNEKVPQLNPLIMCFGPDKIYTTDHKNSILILDPNNGTTSILTTIPPITSYISRSMIFKGITEDGKYLTVIDDYKIDETQNNNLSNYPTILDQYKFDQPQTVYLSNYLYRIDTTTGNFMKVDIFNTEINMYNDTFYNKFTDTLYYRPLGSLSQPVPYKFTGLSTFTIGTSTEIFPSKMYGSLYLDKDTVCYIERNVIKRWNLVTGVETIIIGTEYIKISVGGRYNYASPVQFANIYPYLQFHCSYDSFTDTLAVIDNSAKCVILIKNVLSGTAFIREIIGKPNTDLSSGYVNTTALSKTFNSGIRITLPIVPNQTGTNTGIKSGLVLTNPEYVYIIPRSTIIFVLNLDLARVLSACTYDDVWKYYTVFKIQGNIVAPFTLYNTSTPML